MLKPWRCGSRRGGREPLGEGGLRKAEVHYERMGGGQGSDGPNYRMGPGGGLDGHPDAENAKRSESRTGEQGAGKGTGEESYAFAVYDEDLSPWF